MIKHIVFWQLKEHALGNSKAHNMQLMQEKLMSCAKLNAGMLKFEVALAQPHLESTYDVVLYSEFDSQASLEAYASHPTHEAIKGFIGEVRSARQCMDYEV